ncbi:MAG: nucleotide exchange factor GrpE [Deltaproteobacteria bacterium]|jgi:molecular chaperone GrpE|nr:nucleotide exchange factor GrpE [Deltaproteobacteria bacterium]
MNKKNPYGMGSEYNPDDILKHVPDRPGGLVDFDASQDIFTSASAGQDNEQDAGAVAENTGPDITFEQLRSLAKEHLCPSCPAAKEADDTRLRSLAEIDNMRKRVQKEKDEAIKFAASNVLSDILPALDNLDLALEHAKGQDSCKDFFIGVDMTRKLLLDTLKNHGLVVIGSAGELFDPSVHEAVGTSQDPRVADGAVSAILNKGYKLHDRLLRPARVIVCKK